MTPGDRPGALLANMLGFWLVVALGLLGLSPWVVAFLAILRAVRS